MRPRKDTEPPVPRLPLHADAMAATAAQRPLHGLRDGVLMPLGDPYLPQPSPEMILEEWKNLYMPKESHPQKQPVCAHKSVCTYVDRNTYCFYERKGIHCCHYLSADMVMKI